MTLDEFLEQNRHRRKRWSDQLPPEIIAELRRGQELGASCADLARWLRGEGYKEANGQKVRRILLNE